MANGVEAYKRFITQELARKEAELPLYQERIAAELSSRGILGGGAHIHKLGELAAEQERYKSDLLRRLAELEVAKQEREEIRKQTEKEAKQARLAGYIQTLIPLMVEYGAEFFKKRKDKGKEFQTPYLSLFGIRSLLKKPLTEILHKKPITKAYENVPLETAISEIANKIQNLRRPKGRISSLLPESWQTNLWKG